MEDNFVDKIIITGGNKLAGTVKIEGAKNAVLPVITAALLASEGISTFYNVPNLSDVQILKELFTVLGAKVTYDPQENKMTIDASGPIATEAPEEYVSKIRASFLVLGPMLARNNIAKVSMPGGCTIGARPIEQHLNGFMKLGATITTGEGFVEAKVNEHLEGKTIFFDFPSVGGTQNVIMASVLAKGTTILENIAQEPEITDLVDFLISMGASIQGRGSSRLIITGVDKLVGATHHIIPDRIEAGTFMCAAAMTQGDIKVIGALREHHIALIDKLEKMGVIIKDIDNGLHIIGPEVLTPTNITTLPYPGFATDMQSQLMAVMLAAKGQSTVTETVFENRFMHAGEFNRMGAHVTVNSSKLATVDGGHTLQGAKVKSTDLRSSAALILAGLIAEGTTTVTELRHLDRGYVNFHGKLADLGANIQRISE